MIFTKEQFDDILGYDKFLYLDDLPFGELEDKGLKLFNGLDDQLQGLAVQWGTSDSVFRDDLFEFLIENQFGMTVKDYYATGLCKKNDVPFDYTLLPKYKKNPVLLKLTKKYSNISYKNKDKRVAFDETFGQDKMDLASKVIGDKSAELKKKLDEQNELSDSMKIAAQTIGLDLTLVKPTGYRIECVSPTFVYSNPGVILFEKDYNGFEDMFDLDRDMSELMQFENRDKIPSEFSGIVRVLVEYYPSNEDLEQIKILQDGATSKN